MGAFGRDRRSGVPALVVVDSTDEEIAFLAAEAQGPSALKAWPLDAGAW